VVSLVRSRTGRRADIARALYRRGRQYPARLVASSRIRVQEGEGLRRYRGGETGVVRGVVFVSLSIFLFFFFYLLLCVFFFGGGVVIKYC